MNITRVHDLDHPTILKHTGIGAKIELQPMNSATVYIAKGESRSYFVTAYHTEQFGDTKRKTDVWLILGTPKEQDIAIATIQNLASKIFSEAQEKDAARKAERAKAAAEELP
jgi:hypothetical protein